MFHIADDDLKIIFILPQIHLILAAAENFFFKHMIYTVFLQGQSTDLGAVSKVEYSGLQMKKERIKLKKQFMEHFFPKGNGRNSSVNK